MKSLKLLLKETLIREIFRDPRRPRKQNSSSFIDHETTDSVNELADDSPFAWAVLVVDSSTLQILQSCFQTHELTSENIACIEMLHNNKRSPIPLHAIYFLSVVSRTFLYLSSHEIPTFLMSESIVKTNKIILNRIVSSLC